MNFLDSSSKYVISVRCCKRYTIYLHKFIRHKLISVLISDISKTTILLPYFGKYGIIPMAISISVI